MASRGHALSRDALIRTLTAYSGITTEDGEADGTTLVDSNLIDRNDFVSEKTILIMSGDAKDEDKGSTAFDETDGKITVQGTGFSAQIKAGTIFRVLNISTVEMDVANIDTKIGTNTDDPGTTTLFAWLARLFALGGQGLVYYGKVTQIDDATHFRVAGLTGFGDAYFANTYRVYVVRDAAGLGAAPQGEMQPCSGYDSDDGIFTYTAFTAPLAVDDEVLLIHERIAEIADLLADIKGATGIFHEQADAAINASIVAGETFIVTLTTANTRYILRNLRLKSADPGAGETITVKLYEFINDGEVNVDSFVIDHDNYMTHFTLMDMFGLPQIAGDSIRVSLTGSAAGPIVVTGQYSHAKTNV